MLVILCLAVGKDFSKLDLFNIYRVATFFNLFILNLILRIFGTFLYLIYICVQSKQFSIRHSIFFGTSRLNFLFIE